MAADWSIVVDAGREYYINKKNNRSSEYLFIRRALIGANRDKIMEYFEAGSDKEAIRIGRNLARKYGLCL